MNDNKLAKAILIILLTTIFAAIPAAAILDSRVSRVENIAVDHEGRIKKVEGHVASDEKASEGVNRRLDRIEAKLDRLIERGK